MNSIQKSATLLALLAFLFLTGLNANAQTGTLTVPLIEDGQAQIIPEFENLKTGSVTIFGWKLNLTQMETANRTACM